MLITDPVKLTGSYKKFNPFQPGPVLSKRALEKEKNMPNPFVRKLAETEYVRNAIAERADLSVFNERPTPRIIFGLCVIGGSYIIGWPVITALGVLSVYLHQPMIDRKSVV